MQGGWIVVSVSFHKHGIVVCVAQIAEMEFLELADTENDGKLYLVQTCKILLQSLLEGKNVDQKIIEARHLKMY